MTAKLRHTRRQHTITDVYEITDVARVESLAYGDIKPQIASVTLDYDDDEGKWALTWLTLRGPMYKGNGKLGVRWLDHLHSDTGLPDAPEWAQELVRQSLAEATGPAPSAMLMPIQVDAEPEADSIRFRMGVCTSCSEQSPWSRDSDAEIYEWNVDHHAATGHHVFHVFNVERTTATIYMV